ncbi:hypothetical protein GCM10019016_098340 [Streptomyces prasinosporus]|uniref:LigA protein n=1 Tax=Streptomyces prasinosporus TaxID=68256 RepID=A0ABP6U6E6_9ACTN
MLYRWDGTAWTRDDTFPGAGEPGRLGKVQFVGEEVWVFHQREGAGEVLRRSAGGWSVVPLPQTLWTYQDFTAVPGAAWVVGEDDTGLKVLHHDGSGWTAQSVPDGVLYLMGITARTATDAWAWADTRTGTTVLRRDGNGWRDVPAPPGSVYGPHILAADDVWAAGATDSGAAVSHWDGQAWRQTIVDGFPRSAVGSVLAVSSTEVWAGGTAGFVGGRPGRPIPPLLVRWDGREWNRVAVPTDFGSVSSLAPTASGAPVRVAVARSQKWGPPGGNPPLVPGPDFLVWDGRSFTEYSEPAVAGEGDSRVLRLTPVPGTATVWSVGRADGPEGTFAPRILRFG